MLCEGRGNSVVAVRQRTENHSNDEVPNHRIFLSVDQQICEAGTVLLVIVHDS
jgi:hypothetical protein